MNVAWELFIVLMHIEICIINVQKYGNYLVLFSSINFLV